MGGTVESAGTFASQNPDALLRLGAQMLNPKIRPVAQLGAGLWEQSLYPQRAKDWISSQMAVEAEKAGRTTSALPSVERAETELGTDFPVRATAEQRMRALVPPRAPVAAAAGTAEDVMKSRQEEEQRRKEQALLPLGKIPPVVSRAPVPFAAPLTLPIRQQPTMEDIIRMLMQRRGQSIT